MYFLFSLGLDIKANKKVISRRDCNAGGALIISISHYNFVYFLDFTGKKISNDTINIGFGFTFH